MDVFLIVAPIFALILIGYAAAYLRLLSEGAHRSLTEFAFGIAVPALMFRTLATAEFPAVSPVKVWAAYFGAIAATWALALLATRALLRRQHQPILVIWGRQDRLVPLAVADQCRRVRPDLPVRVIDRAGHCPHDERPEQFNHQLLSWLATLMPPPSSQADA